MELVTALKLGPRSIPIIGHHLQANRARHRAEAFASGSTTNASTTVIGALVNHRNVVVAEPHENSPFRKP
jgi:hypothetical protein